MEGRILNYSVGIFLLLAVLVAFFRKPSAPTPITIYTAKKIITLDPNQSKATAIAVKDNKIYSIGSLEDMETWMKPGSYKVNNVYINKIIKSNSIIAIGQQANFRNPAIATKISDGIVISDLN